MAELTLPEAQPLRPRARLMLTLGLELISSEAVAVSELVKNSYDADASTVLISLTDGDAASPPSLLLLDDGTGMSAATVAGTWLEPATPSRRRRKVSPAGRRSLGEKGIGRFATVKLGHRLSLATRDPVGPANEVVLEVDWDQFADESRYLDEVRLSWGERAATIFGATGTAAQMWREQIARHHGGPLDGRLMPDPGRGTLLRVDGLRTEWDESVAGEVSRTLSRLISPAADAAMESSQRDFRILLDLPTRLSRYAGWLGAPDELRHPHYRLEAAVDVEGNAVVSMHLRGKAQPVHKRQTLRGTKGGASPVCGPFSFSLHVWDRDRLALAELGADTRFQDFRRLLDEVAGVSIYRDGFRVLPYGEFGDDWLALDRRRINDPTRRLSNNQVIGAVSIGRDSNPDLIDQSNREGLVEGSALADLRTLLKSLMAMLEFERYELRPRVSTRPRAKIGVLDTFQLSAIRAAVEERDDRPLLAIVEDTQDQLDEHSTEVRETVSRYQRLASLGQLVDRLMHEIAQPTAAVRQATVAGLEMIEDRSSATLASCESLVDSLRDQLLQARDQAKVIVDVVRRVAPFGGRRRGRPHEIAVETAMNDVKVLLSGEISGEGVTVTVPDTHTKVTVDRTELQEILLNLVSNSLYWVVRSTHGDPRQIALRVDRNDDGSLTIVVSDNGPGVPAENRDRIFEPYFTTREDGVGLGLTLAGQIVEDYYGGVLELVNPGELGGATFKATLRRRVGA